LFYNRDRAASNTTAIQLLCTPTISPIAVDVPCFSHALDLVGNRVVTPTASTFMSHFNTAISSSVNACKLWKDICTVAAKKKSKTRWWSYYEQSYSVALNFGYLDDWIAAMKAAGVCTAATTAMETILFNNSFELALQLAVTVDSMERFVKATYNLEGDGFLAPITYTAVKALKSFADTFEATAGNPQHSSTPNLDGVIQQAVLAAPFVRDHVWVAAAYATAVDCVRPALTYFKATFFDHAHSPQYALFNTVNLFKAARLFDPRFINGLRPVNVSIALHSLICLTRAPSQVPALMTELSDYCALSEDFELLEPKDTEGMLAFFQAHRSQIPAWAEAAKRIALLQPSSAGVERVFSLLNSLIGDHQESMLEDVIEVSLMAQINSTKR
jgi:hypothetical protein